MHIHSFIYFISILSLYTEGDAKSVGMVAVILLFQSSPSIQRETLRDHGRGLPLEISILSLYTEGDVNCFLLWPLVKISILSLYTEGDWSSRASRPDPGNFNPLPLYRGRPSLRPGRSPRWHFNPLPLYRGRLQSCTIYYI